MKDDRVYLGHILRCISRIEEYTSEGREKFFASHLVQDGVIRNVQTLAESSHEASLRRGAEATWGAEVVQVPHNIQLEPARPIFHAIMSPKRAAQLEPLDG
ncbi:MAG: hypothetical protein HYZ89_01065 [Candidatus Omnitrophica bacterium]|nr:hypothetical protein [Candidatus Omnitrophota bacterium]